MVLAPGRPSVARQGWRPSKRWPRSCFKIVPRMRENGRLVGMQKLFLAMAIGLAMVLPSGPVLAGNDLDAVKKRGMLICGVAAGGLAGFMMVDSQGKWKGLDVDVCRAVAATIFGDSEKVKYVPLSGQQRFTALQS